MKILKRYRMKRIVTRKTDKQTVIHRCGECGLAVFDREFENLSLAGEPTLVSCPQSGRFKKVVSETACSQFVLRQSVEL